MSPAEQLVGVVLGSVLSGASAAAIAGWRNAISSAKREAAVDERLKTLAADVATVKKRLGLSNGDTAVFVSVERCDDHHETVERRLTGQDALIVEIRNEVRSIVTALTRLEAGRR